MEMTLDFDEFWPRWPEDAQERVLLDLSLQVRFDDLVQLLWSPDSDFIAEANRERDFVDVNCTAWVASASQLPDLPSGFSWTYDRDSGNASIGNIQEKLRKIRFESKNGNVLSREPFKSEEVQRCLIYEDQNRAVVDGCVLTTAPYCEKIRVICRYTVEAMGRSRCQLTVSYCLVFLETYNVLLRGIIERGVKGEYLFILWAAQNAFAGSIDGLTSNYRTYGRILTSYIPEATHPQSVAASVIEEERVNVGGLHMEQYFLECIISPATVVYRYPYETAVNWKVLLPFLRLHPLTGSKSSKSVLERGFDLLFGAFMAVIYSFFVASLFNLWTLLRENVLPDSEWLALLPPLSFGEGAMTGLLFIALLEMALLCTHMSQKMLLFLRVYVITCCAAASDTLRKLSALVRRSVHDSALVREDSHGSEPNTPGSRVTPDADPSREGQEAENPAGFGRLLNGFMTLISYTRSDFRKFDHSKPIGAQTDADGSVIEEIFENERIQPFRGWGHTWPGHFLPTDKFSHWSSFDANGDIITSDIRDSVEPKLPAGWSWQDDWKVDASKADSQMVDENGWYYGLDFIWIKFSPEKNNGVRTMTDFVRRRRWIRSRVHVQESSPNPSESVGDPSQSAIDPPPLRRQHSYFSFLQFL